MNSDALTRRRMLFGAGGAAAAAGVALVATAAPVSANTLMSSSDSAHQHRLVGTWLVTHTDDPSASTPSPQPGLSTISFIPGGILIIHDVNPPGPPAQGSWATNEHGGVDFSFLGGGQQPPSGPNAPPAIFILTVTGSGTMHSDSLSGTYTFTVTDGNNPPKTLDSGTGTFTATPYSAQG